MSDNLGQQILCKTRSSRSGEKIKELKSLILCDFLGICSPPLKILIKQHSCSFLLGSVRRLLRMARRILAPLRRIVSRDLEVFEFRHKSVHPQSFAVHDRLECGHVHTSLLWDIFDLLDGYTTNPEVSAKRHRCRPCAQLLATKKPVASAAPVAAEGVA